MCQRRAYCASEQTKGKRAAKTRSQSRFSRVIYTVSPRLRFRAKIGCTAPARQTTLCLDIVYLMVSRYHKNSPASAQMPCATKTCSAKERIDIRQSVHL